MKGKVIENLAEYRKVQISRSQSQLRTRCKIRRSFVFDGTNSKITESLLFKSLEISKTSLM